VATLAVASLNGVTAHGSPSGPLQFDRLWKLSRPPDAHASLGSRYFLILDKNTCAPRMPNFMVRLCSLDQSNHSFQGYAVSIEDGSRSEGLALTRGKEQWKYGPCP
jgi:hypothetical protein